MRLKNLIVPLLLAAVAAWSLPASTYACPKCDQHAKAGAAQVEAKDAAAQGGAAAGCTEGCCNETCKGNCPMEQGKECPHAKEAECPHAKEGECPHAKQAPAEPEKK